MAGFAIRSEAAVLKWLLTTVLALFVLSALTDKLSRLGFGRLPGDFTVTIGGRKLPVPLGSTLLLSVMAAGIAKFL